MHDVRKPCDARILAIEYDGSGGRFRGLAQQSCGVVDFAEAVELVAHHIEQQTVIGLHLPDEMYGICLIEFQNRDIRIQLAGKRDLTQQRRDHTTCEVRAGRVREYLQSQRFQHARHHARGGRLAVRTGDQHHAERQAVKRTCQKAGVDPFDDLARERAAATMCETGGRANGLADQWRRKGVPSHITPPAGSPAACP